MDLSARKYHFIQKLIGVANESTMEILESVLKREIEVQQEISPVNKKELDRRTKSHKSSPEDLLNWDEIKTDW
jgi:hypothetical protein